VTAGQVSEEARLAHGTFYRYFRDKHEALRAAIEQVREAVDWTVLVAERPVGKRAVERRRVKHWAEGILRAPIERAGLARAWFAALDADPQIARQRAERRERTTSDLGAYIERLNSLGIARVPRPRGTAVALLALIDATTRSGIAAGGVDAEQIEGTLSVIDRAIFGR
jgi:AcrR family transcriptional regulator